MKARRLKTKNGTGYFITDVVVGGRKVPFVTFEGLKMSFNLENFSIEDAERDFKYITSSIYE